MEPSEGLEPPPPDYETGVLPLTLARQVVPQEGVEPSRPKTPASETGMAANYITGA